jgi:hypothetical protein
MSKSKINVTPANITQAWQTGMTNAVTKIVTGVNAVTDSPMEKAALAGQKMAQKVQESVANGRHAAGCRSVSLADWKNLTATKVQARLATGVQAAGTKHQTFATWLVNRINTGLPAIAAMPSMTIEDSIARQTAWTRFMASAKYKS